MRLYLEKALFFSPRAGLRERFLQPHQGCTRLRPSRTCLRFKLFSGFKYMKGKFVGTSGFPCSEGFRALLLLLALFLPLFLSLCPSALPPSSLSIVWPHSILLLRCQQNYPQRDPQRLQSVTTGQPASHSFNAVSRPGKTLDVSRGDFLSSRTQTQGNTWPRRAVTTGFGSRRTSVLCFGTWLPSMPLDPWFLDALFKRQGFYICPH